MQPTNRGGSPRSRHIRTAAHTAIATAGTIPRLGPTPVIAPAAFERPVMIALGTSVKALVLRAVPLLIPKRPKATNQAA